MKAQFPKMPVSNKVRWGVNTLFGCGVYENIAETLEFQARRNPDKIAVTFGESRRTYDQLNEESNKMARALARYLNVHEGDRVCYLLPNCIEEIALYYAIQKMGAIAVPIPYRFISREIRFILASCDACAIVCDDSRETDIDTALSPELHHLQGWLSTNTLIELASREDRTPFPSPRDLSLVSRIQYTGGSTGTPKGATRTQFADLAECESVLKSNGLAKNDVVLIQSPLEHHGGHSWLISSIAVGATIVLCGKFDPKTILRAIDENQATHLLVLPPTSYVRLLACRKETRADLSSVKLVQSAAGAMTKKALDAIFEAFPNAFINYGWGQSESGSGTSIAITRDLLGNERQLQSIGTPMPGVEIKIVNEKGNCAMRGEMGEALVRCPAVMSGYWGQPQLTAKAFDGEWLRTGDIMIQDDDGYFYLVSRKKNVIKSGGENVFASEVERTILSCPGVHDCIVYGVDDPIMGEAVAAIVECEAGTELTSSQVLGWCKRHLASYKKPRYVSFVESLGRNDAGKVTCLRKLQCLEEARC